MGGIDEWGALLPGSRIAGYEIKRKLGQGGFGIAYEAFHPALHQRAAIKEFFPRDMVARSGTSVSVREGESRGFYERFLKRFIEEARAVNKLDHPNIVKVRHFEEANNTAYVVMDYVDGQNLKGWLEERRGKLAESDLRCVFAPILDALAYVHDQNVLHRDISPLNIMVDRTGKPWLIDFGAFKDMWQEQPRRTSLLAANPAYAPPEQSDAGAGQDHGPFTDVFALSATMYEAIAGHKPASATARMSQLAFRRADTLAPLETEAVVKCRPEMLRAVMRGLSLSPEDRPQTVAAFRQEIGWGAETARSTARPGAGAGAATTPVPRPISEPRIEALRPATTPPHPLQLPPPAIAPQGEQRRGGKGKWIALSAVLLIGLAGAGLWSMREPIFDKMADIEYATIATSTDATAHEAFAKKHLGTRAGQRAEQRAADLRRQQASAETERQRQARHAAAAAEWARVKETSDEKVVERFIEAHPDTPVAADARARLASLKQQREAREREARHAAAAAEWNRLKASEDEAAIERFLSTYGDTPSATEARTRLASIRQDKATKAEAERQKQTRITLAANEWSRIKDTTDEKLIERFIEAHPDTPAAAEAKTMLADLRRPKGPRVLTVAEERALKPKDEFQECAICPRMVVVPAGEFLMGSPPDEKDRSSDEGPQHRVAIPHAFAVGKFTVTFAEWDACAADGGCQSNKTPSDQGWGRYKRPVINVSWNDAQEYVAWLKKKTGKDYRLLSEAEWEYAARANTTTRYWWGSDIGSNQANCNGCGSQWDSKQTAPVGSFAANPFGLYDMHGNVWQWIEDCYVNSYNGAPINGVPRLAQDCGARVRRGGSWLNLPQYLRSAHRISFSTGNRFDFLGFRLGRTLDVPEKRSETPLPATPSTPEKQASVTPPANAPSALPKSTIKPSDYPARPITLIVPFGAGSNLDTIARLLSQRLAKTLRQSIVVTNKGGASGVVGLIDAAQAKADGYTFVISGVIPFVSPKPSDPAERLRGVGLIGEIPVTIVARTALPAKSFDEFVQYLRTNGISITQAYAQTGSPAHLTCLMLKQKIGANNPAVPFVNESPAVVELVAGNVGYVCSNSTVYIAPQIASGELRAYAITASRRLASLPNVPTVKELGHPDIQLTSWIGLFTSKDTPSDIIAYVNAALDEALDDAEVEARLTSAGLLIASKETRAPESLDRLMAQEKARLAPLLKSALP